jgi:hypothetical protein
MPKVMEYYTKGEPASGAPAAGAAAGAGQQEDEVIDLVSSD